MSIAITLAAVATWLAWIALCVHWLRRPGFAPILGRGWSTRLFWLLCLAPVHPLLMLLYLVFGVRARPESVPSTGRRVAVVAVAALLLAVDLAPPPRFAAGPLSLVRNESGAWDRQGAGETDGSMFHCHLATAVWKSSTSSTATETHGMDRRLALGRVAILLRGGDPLLTAAGRALQKELTELPFVQRVDLYPAGTLPDSASRPPDVHVVLGPLRWGDTSLPMYRSVEATLRVRASNQPVPGHETDRASELLGDAVGLEWSCDLTWERVRWGYVNRAARLALVSEALGASLAGQIGKVLRDWRADHPAAPDHPDALFGAPRARSDVPGDAVAGASPVWRSGGFLHHELALWEWADARSSAEVLGDVRVVLERAGWQADADAAEEMPERLFFISGDRRIQVRSLPPPAPIGGVRGGWEPERLIEGEPTRAGDGGDTPGGNYQLLYRDPFDKDEISAALDALIASRPPAEALLALRSCWPADRHEELLDVTASRPAATAEGALAVARRMVQEGRRASGADFVLQTRALALARSDRKLDGTIREDAGSLELTDVLEMPLTDDLLIALGWLATGSGRVHELALAPGDVAHLFSRDEEGTVTVLQLSAGHVTDGGVPLTVHLVGEGGLATSSVDLVPTGKEEAWRGGRGLNHVVFRWRSLGWREWRLHLAVQQS